MVKFMLGLSEFNKSIYGVSITLFFTTYIIIIVSALIVIFFCII